jgi:chemotaxis protein CheX
MSIEAQYVNPFIEAAMGVVKQVAGVQMRRGHLSYKVKPEPSYNVTIIIGVYGFLIGQVVYSMRQEVAERLVEKMLGEAEIERDELLFVDTLGELANMITGNATANLNQDKEISLKITTPAIVTGENLSVNLVKKPTLVLGLISSFGPIEISISLEQKESEVLKGFSKEARRIISEKKGR